MAKGGNSLFSITTFLTSFAYSPSIFIIKKVKDSLYKQDSMIQNLDTLDQINIKIKEL